MQLFKAFKTTALINGLTKDVVISIETDHDEADLSHMESDERAKTERRLERGQLDCVWVKVTARFSELSHFEGTDSLGQVFVSSPKDLEDTVSEYDMSQNAIADLVAQTLQGVESIQTFLKGA
ncbi:MAG: hypothetical protein HC840_00535 [Leptolyngbyaceae cyanobacterium RM2_2_4]|nr:hypothetical protein [Leptolyngbyaceae cyanobacterium RM2_2_4]